MGDVASAVLVIAVCAVCARNFVKASSEVNSEGLEWFLVLFAVVFGVIGFIGLFSFVFGLVGYNLPNGEGSASIAQFVGIVSIVLAVISTAVAKIRIYP